jgi:phosphoglycolate phosphatase
MAAFDKLYGIPADIGEHGSAGETDPQVARATFRGVLNRDPASAELAKLYAEYLLHLSDDITRSPATACFRPSSKR